MADLLGRDLTAEEESMLVEKFGPALTAAEVAADPQKAEALAAKCEAALLEAGAEPAKFNPQPGPQAEMMAAPLTPLEAQSNAGIAGAIEIVESGQAPELPEDGVPVYSKESDAKRYRWRSKAYRKISTTWAMRHKGPFVIETPWGMQDFIDGYVLWDARGYPWGLEAPDFELIYVEVGK